MNLLIINRLVKLVLINIIVILWSCTSNITDSQPLKLKKPEEYVIEKAEKMFKQKSYISALNTYYNFLKQYPNSSSADIALDRVAKIQGYLGDENEKLKTYRRLAIEYPYSPYAPTANFEIMVNFYNNGEYRDVILQASKIIEETKSKELLFKTYVILAETQISLGSPIDSVLFYNTAYSKANPAEKKYVLKKILNILYSLSEKKVNLVFNHLDDKSMKSYLLFNIAQNELENKNIHRAKRLFLKFIEEFPHHENINKAKLMTEELSRRASFRSGLIGCMLPLSGKYEIFGNRALDAIKLALKEFKLKNNLDLQLLIRDTKSDFRTINNIVVDLDNKGVGLIVGPMITSEWAAAEAQKRGIPIITLTQKIGITEIGDYVFRNFLTPQLQVETLVSCAIEQFEAKRFAILYPDELYGKTFMKLFWKKVKYYGANVVYVDSYLPKQTDFSATIKKIAKIKKHQEKRISSPHRGLHKKENNENKNYGIALDFDAIFIPDDSSTVSLIAPQLAYWDVNDVLLIGTNLWHSDFLIQSAQDYVQDAILTDVFYHKSSKSNVKVFNKTFERLYNRIPGFIEGLAYDTAMISFHIFKDQKIQSRENLKDKLIKAVNYKGLTGLTSFKNNGEVQKNLYLLQINKDNFIELNDH
jgi:ABC-type branched-subunit amino acid transport system substrate-binding protein/TolA-binding protein